MPRILSAGGQCDRSFCPACEVCPNAFQETETELDEIRGRIRARSPLLGPQVAPPRRAVGVRFLGSARGG